MREDAGQSAPQSPGHDVLLDIRAALHVLILLQLAGNSTIPEIQRDRLDQLVAQERAR